MDAPLYRQTWVSTQEICKGEYIVATFLASKLRLYGRKLTLFNQRSQELERRYSTLIYSEQSVRQAEAIFLHASFCLLLLCSIAALLYVHNKIWQLVIVGLSTFVASLLSVGFLDLLNKSSLALVAGYVLRLSTTPCQVFCFSFFRR